MYMLCIHYYHYHEARISLTLSLSLSLAIRPYHPSPPIGFQDYILSSHGAVVGKLLLVGQHWHISVKGSIEERHF